MFNVGGGEIIVIFLIALIVLGPDKLPGAARQAGKYLSEFRRMSSGFQQELRDAMDLSNLTSPTPTKPQSSGGPTTVVADVTEVPSTDEHDGGSNGSAPQLADPTAAEQQVTSADTTDPGSTTTDPAAPVGTTEAAVTEAAVTEASGDTSPPTGAAAIPSAGPMIIDGPSGSFS